MNNDNHNMFTYGFNSKHDRKTRSWSERYIAVVVVAAVTVAVVMNLLNYFNISQ
jgi:riboflavin transporter FmnP